MLETIKIASENFATLVWGLPLVIGLVFSGILLTFYFGFPQIVFFKNAIQIISGKYDNPEDQGDISHFQALCAALSGTLGLGNIAGVAMAISLGGPGAVFWLWVAGFIGMVTKFAEVTLSVMYRDIGPDGKVHGGPMYVIKNALSKKYYPFAWMYAFFAILSCFGAGNMFQSNQVANLMKTTFAFPEWATGAILGIGAAMVLIGGIKRIGQLTEKLVPFMVGIYFLASLVILISKIDAIPQMFLNIFTGAFSGTAALGGFAGVTVKEVIIMGIRRATFSNEAGLGTASIAHAAAKSTPIQEGIVALLEPFIDTVVVCTITALVVLLTNTWTIVDIGGSEMTAVAFESVMGIWGRWIVVFSVALFAFATIVSWSYYGEQATQFLWGAKKIIYYRWAYVGFIFLGAVMELSTVINLSDGVYGLLAIPNMLAVYLLLPKIKVALNEYKVKLKSGQIKTYK